MSIEVLLLNFLYTLNLQYAAANLLYEADHNQKKFAFLHCYLELCQSPKWAATIVSKNKKKNKKSKGKKRVAASTLAPVADQQVVSEAADNDAASVDGHDSDGIPALRHVHGRKKAKKMAKEGHAYDKAFDQISESISRSNAELAGVMQLQLKADKNAERKILALEDANNALRENTRAYQRRTDQELFFMDISSITDPVTVAFFEDSRKLALLRLREDVTKAEAIEDEEEESYGGYEDDYDYN